MAKVTIFIISADSAHKSVQPNILFVFKSTIAFIIPSVSPITFALGIVLTSNLAVFISKPFSKASFSLNPTLDKFGSINTEYGINFLSSVLLFPSPNKLSFIILKSSKDIYVNWGPPLTSPIAQILGTFVFSLLLTATAPLSVTLTPAASKFNSSVFGFLPIAIKTASPLILFNLPKLFS